MKMIKKIDTLLVQKIFILCASIFIGVMLLTLLSDKKVEQRILPIQEIFSSEDKLNFESVEHVWNVLHEKYLNSRNIDDHELAEGAIRGMLEAIDDPHTSFFDDLETAEILETLNGSFEGVGIQIQDDEGSIVILHTLRNSPAEKANLQEGDIILEVDGTSITGMDINEVVTLIRGEKGTEVVLGIDRDGNFLSVPIIRDFIDGLTVRYKELEDNIAHINIYQFAYNTATEFETAINEMIENGNDKMILDIRYNPGGVLPVVVDVAGFFIEKDEIVLIEDRVNENVEHKSDGPATLRDFPVVILQNEYSASASEILSGALKDINQTYIIGNKSYGKGTIQDFERLPGDTSIKYTTTMWKTPSGNKIEGVGVEPNHVVLNDLDSEGDEQLDWAVEFVKNL